MSLAAVAAELDRRGVDFDIIHDRSRLFRPTVPSCADRETAWTGAEPAQYAVVAFICGPLPTEWPNGRNVLLRFSNARRIAAGATVTSPEAKAHALAVFHEFYCRDGFDARWMDLSLAGDWPTSAPPADARGPLALCWRGAEPLFARRGCGDRLVSSLVELMLERRGVRAETIDTNIVDPADDPARLDSQFGGFDLVITTRLHGALLSLRNLTPFVAIDQIVGGLKVLAMGENLGWPHTFAVERLSLEALERACESLQSDRFRASMVPIRDRAVERAKETLSAVCDSIERHAARRLG